jgi:hypothetical protein
VRINLIKEFEEERNSKNFRKRLSYIKRKDGLSQKKEKRVNFFNKRKEV